MRLALVLVVAAVVSVGAALAATAGWRVQPSLNPGRKANVFWAVAATSSTNAWAVGDYCPSIIDQGDGTLPCRTIVEHRKGKAWKVQRSPNPDVRKGFDDELYGVAATSATNAWAVGYYAANNRGTPKINTLIEHWNGKAWKVQRSPNPTHQNTLYGVAATSAHNAWAVGYSSTLQILIEHWNGKAWEVQPSNNPDSGILYGVTATSPTNAWAVGYYYTGSSTTNTLIEHWNGKVWKVQPSPSAGGFSNDLSAVDATSPHNAWAVGYYVKNNRSNDKTLVEHWNGKVWKLQRSPNPGGSNGTDLTGLAATSSTNAWAVGRYFTRDATKIVVEHWGGRAWKVQPSPNPRGAYLSGVAATSRASAWAVGYYDNNGKKQTLVERWRGRS